MLEIKNFSKAYSKGKKAVDNISLTVNGGEIFGFIGHNGAGKTTTIKSILGMVKPTNGNIEVLDCDISKDIKIKQDIAYVGDVSGFLEESKISNLHKVISNFYSNWDEELYKKYINEFKVNEDKAYKDLSKGQKKQFELIMALSHHPKLLIMDEPTSSLDPLIRNDFLELMQRHMELDNMTVFYSTHITTDLDKAADYIVMIYNGNIILQDEKDSILENHIIVKIKKDLLYNNLRKEFISLKENSFSFEGLMSNKDKAYELFGDEAIYEKCTLEDILMYYTMRA